MRCRNNGSCFLPFFTIQLILWWSSFLFPYVLVSPHRTLPQSPQTKKTSNLNSIYRWCFWNPAPFENITVFKRILYTTVVFLSGFLNQQQYKTLPGYPRVVCLQVGRWKPRSDLERENVWKNWRRLYAWTLYLMLEHVFFKTQLISVCCLTEHFLELQANEEPGVEDWFQSYGDTCFRKHQNYWFLQIWVFFFEDTISLVPCVLLGLTQLIYTLTWVCLCASKCFCKSSYRMIIL